MHFLDGGRHGGRFAGYLRDRSGNAWLPALSCRQLCCFFYDSMASKQRRMADDFSHGSSSRPRHLQEVYFPKTGRGTILLTTRNFVTDESMAVVDLNELKMDDDTALRLLLRKNLTDDPKALDIVRELGHLPLAIDLAGALMAEDKTTPSKLLERYRKDVVSYLRLDDMLELTNSAYGKTVWTVWSVSITFGDALRPAPKMMTPSRPKIIPSRPHHLSETSASPPP